MPQHLSMSRRGQYRRGVVLSAAVTVVTLLGLDARAVDITQSVTFTTSGQSLYDTGPSQPIVKNYDISFFNVNSNGPLFNFSSGGDFITANGSFIAGAGMKNTLKVDPGAIAATLSNNVTVALPTFGDFSAGKFQVKVVGSQYNQAGSTLTTSSPVLQFSSDLTFDLKAQFDGAAQATFLGQTYGGTFDQTIVDRTGANNLKFNLLSYNTGANGLPDGKVTIMSNVFKDTPLGKFFDYNKAVGNLLNTGFDKVVPKYKPPVDKPKDPPPPPDPQPANPSLEKAKPEIKPLTFSTAFETDPIFSTEFSIPSISLGNGANPVTTTATNFSSFGKSEFAALKINIGSLLGRVLPYAGIPFPPLGAKAKLDFKFGNASASVTAADISLRPALNMTEKATIVPQATTVGFNWETPLSARILRNGELDTLGTDMRPYAVLSSVTGLGSGDRLEFENAIGADSQLKLTPIYSAHANLTSEFGVSLSASIPIELLKGKLKGEIFGFSKDVKIGPAFSANIPLFDTNPFVFYTNTFALGGWEDATGSALVLSTEAYKWTAATSGSLFTTTNYAGQSIPPGGNSVIISNSGPNLLIVNADIDGDNDHRVGRLTVDGNAEVDVLANNSLWVGGNLNLTVGNTVGLKVLNQGKLRFTNPAGSAIDAGAGMVQLVGANSVLQSDGKLTLKSGTITGTGAIQVTGNFEIDSGALVSTSGTLDVTTDLFYNGDNGGPLPSLQATGGSTLKITTPNGSGILGGFGEDRLTMNAANNSTISLFVSDISGVRVTAGQGKISLARNLELSNFVLDAGARVDTANAAQVTLNDASFLNNGTLVATTGSQFLLPASTSVTLTGQGVLQLDGAKLTGPTGSTLTNDASHTTQFIGNGVAELGADNTGAGPAVTNAGLIEAAVGLSGTANLRAQNATGSFVNTGTFRGKGATLTLASGTFKNDGLFEAGQVTFDNAGNKTVTAGSISMISGTTLENLTASGSTITLTGGAYRLADSSCAMDLWGPAATGTDFVNNANIQMLGAGNVAQFFKVNDTKLADMNSFTNGTTSVLALGPGASFVTNNVVNHGTLMLYGTEQNSLSEIGNISNETDGTIAVYPGRQIVPQNPTGIVNSQAIVRLRSVSGIATNKGRITVDGTDDDNTITALIKGDGAATNFRNDGIIDVHGTNATLSFDPAQTLNHAGLNGGANSFQGGIWIVDNATLNLNFNPVPTVLDADVTLVGNSAKLNVSGATTLEASVSRIGAAGKLHLVGHDSTFATGLVNEGLLDLSGSIVTAPNINNAGGTISGAGTLNGNMLNTGTIRAVAGQMTFTRDVLNQGTIRAVAVDTVNNIGAGGIGLDGGVNNPPIVISGGTILIDPGAALWGYGRIAAPGLLINQGTIMANDYYRSASAIGPATTPVGLTLEINPNVQNQGEIVATAGNTLTLTSPTVPDTLNNTGLAAPGYLRVGFVIPVYAGREPLNGHMVIHNTTVVGGGLEVRGADVTPVLDNGGMLDMAATAATRATVDGIGSVLGGVFIDVENGVLRAAAEDKQFLIAPQVGSEAQIWGSLILADNGGVLTLTSPDAGMQAYSLAGTDVLAQGSGATNHNPSRVEIGKAALDGGRLAVKNGGEIALIDNVRFTNVINAAPLTIDNNFTLEVAKTLYGVEGSIDVKTGTLKLDGSQPIGGTTNVASGADVIAGDIRIRQNSFLTVLGTARFVGSKLNNEGTIQLAAGQNLTIMTSPDSPNPSSSVLNSGSLSVTGTTLVIQNVTAAGAGYATDRGLLSQSGGLTNISAGGLLDSNMDLLGGTLKGTGAMTGKLNQTNGTFAPGNSPGIFSVGSYELSGGTLDVEIASLSLFDRVIATSGDVLLNPGGSIVLDLSLVSPSDPLFQLPRIGFDLFDVPSGYGITNGGVTFDLLDGGPFHVESFDASTGTVYLAVPEPASLTLLAIAGLALLYSRHRKHWQAELI